MPAQRCRAYEVSTDWEASPTGRSVGASHTGSHAGTPAGLSLIRAQPADRVRALPRTSIPEHLASSVWNTAKHCSAFSRIHPGAVVEGPLQYASGWQCAQLGGLRIGSAPIVPPFATDRPWVRLGVGTARRHERTQSHERWYSFHRQAEGAPNYGHLSTSYPHRTGAHIHTVIHRSKAGTLPAELPSLQFSP